MTNFKSLSGLGQIADNYEALFCDIWGVIHNGRIPFSEAVDALERFRSERGPVILISNSPRPAVAIPEQFRQIGILSEPWDAIVTSGDATIDELARRAPGPAFKLGPERDDVLYENLDLHFSDIGEAHFLSCTGLFNDDEETPENYRDLLMERAWLDEILGYTLTDDRILAIGDNIFTDLLGAQQEDIDCLFVSGGIHSDKATQLKALLVEHNITARYMSPMLTW